MRVETSELQIDKVHVYYGILLSHKKRQNTFVTTWMGLKNIILSEIHQSGKAKNDMISVICWV